MQKLLNISICCVITLGLQSCMVFDWFNKEFIQHEDPYDPSQVQNNLAGEPRRPANARSVAGSSYGMGQGAVSNNSNPFGQQQMQPQMRQNMGGPSMGGSPFAMQNPNMGQQFNQNSPPVYNVANPNTGQMAILPSSQYGTPPEMMQMSAMQNFQQYRPNNGGLPQANPWAMMPTPSNQNSNISYTPGGMFPSAMGGQGYNGASPYAAQPMGASGSMMNANMPQMQMQPNNIQGQMMPQQFPPPQSPITNYAPPTAPMPQNMQIQMPQMPQIQLPSGPGQAVGTSYIQQQQGFSQPPQMPQMQHVQPQQQPRQFQASMPQQFQPPTQIPVTQNLGDINNLNIPQISSQQNQMAAIPVEDVIEQQVVVNDPSANNLYQQQIQQVQQMQVPQMPQAQYVQPQPQQFAMQFPARAPTQISQANYQQTTPDELYLELQNSLNQELPQGSYDPSQPIMPEFSAQNIDRVMDQSLPVSLSRKYPMPKF